VPRLSIILPVRNGADTIRSALSSVLRFLPNDATVTVLDDGSTDSTPSILADMKHPKLAVLTSKGVGVAKGLNRLLDHTDSMYVARMDADDIALPWRFFMQQRDLERHGADITFSTVTLLRGRMLRPTAARQIPSAAFPLHLMITNPVAHPTMFARRTAIDRVGGYRQVPSEDYDLWLRLALDGAVLRRSAVPGLLYRVHEGQVTASREWRHASWTDPQTQDAYRALSEHVLGMRLSRLLSVASDTSVSRAQFDQHARQLSAAMDRASQGLKPDDRRYLQRTLAARLTNADEVFERSSNTGFSGN